MSNYPSHAREDAPSRTSSAYDLGVMPMGQSPLLIVIDVQREYTTPGRPFYLNGIEESLENCRRVLAHARTMSWPIAHIRHVQDGQLFNGSMPFSRFVEGFEPLPAEMVFTKHNFSCYSNDEFSRLMRSTNGERIYVIGYNSLMCCLSTIVAAFHEGHRMTFVADSSLARSTKSGNEAEAHRYATDIISIYADLATTDEVLFGDHTAN